MSTFQSLGICSIICEALLRMQWKFATSIQEKALPSALSGRDIIGLAETGSGKTGAFVLPIFQSLLDSPQLNTVYALILTPTRELAFQIHNFVSTLGSKIEISSVCIVGGVNTTAQAIDLAHNPHIVIATPGRLVDHLEHTKGFHLRKIKYLIIDEADRMLSMDFENEINKILNTIPDFTKGRQTMLYSATMTSKVKKLECVSLSNPVRVEVNSKFSTPSNLLQYYLFIPAKYKDVYLTYIINEYAGESILVFCRTCNNVKRLAYMLRNLGFPVLALHGQLSQAKRLRVLLKFKNGKRSILICTDVASRGLDIPSVNFVINFDISEHGKGYIHRVGRTARAGRSGTSISMVTQFDVEVYQRLETLIARKLPEFELDEDIVLKLHERVCEAQRLATRYLKRQINTSNIRKGHLTDGDDVDSDGPVEYMLKNELERGYYKGGT